MCGSVPCGGVNRDACTNEPAEFTMPQQFTGGTCGAPDQPGAGHHANLHPPIHGVLGPAAVDEVQIHRQAAHHHQHKPFVRQTGARQCLLHRSSVRRDVQGAWCAFMRRVRGWLRGIRSEHAKNLSTQSVLSTHQGVCSA